MKTIVDITLGPETDNAELKARFLGEDFKILRFGTNGDMDKAAHLLKVRQHQADVISLGFIQSPAGPQPRLDQHHIKLDELDSRLSRPFASGELFFKVCQQWTIQEIRNTYGDDFFENANTIFTSGLNCMETARAISGSTSHIKFCDPVYDNGFPAFINSIESLELYASGMNPLLRRIRTEKIAEKLPPLRSGRQWLMRRALGRAQIIVAPGDKFIEHLGPYGLKEFNGKIVITSSVDKNIVRFCKERGVRMIIDLLPDLLPETAGPDVSPSVIEAMIMALQEKNRHNIKEEDLKECLANLQPALRVTIPSGEYRRTNRFAFVAHPGRKEDLKKFKPIGLAANFAPRLMPRLAEQMMASTPPFIHSKISGIKSPEGVEAEGWLIALGMTPREMAARGPQTLRRRLLSAAELADDLGARLMGMDPLTSALSDPDGNVSEAFQLPVTTGYCFFLSSALWATTEAVRRIGRLEIADSNLFKGKAMVIGAVSTPGTVCSRWLSTAFDELYLIDSDQTRLTSLKNAIASEQKETDLHLSASPDKYLGEMDVIVVASASPEGSPSFELLKVKAGCVIADVNKPAIFTARDADSRQDVMIIDSGDISMPGEPEIADRGFYSTVDRTAMAETVLLCLEGRFENFSTGREDVTWEKVREIHQIGLKHDLKLSGISGPKGILSDTDFDRVREFGSAAMQTE